VFGDFPLEYVRISIGVWGKASFKQADPLQLAKGTTGSDRYKNGLPPFQEGAIPCSVLTYQRLHRYVCDSFDIRNDSFDS
jgi:hypothetical protein